MSAEKNKWVHEKRWWWWSWNQVWTRPHAMWLKRLLFNENDGLSNFEMVVYVCLFCIWKKRKFIARERRPVLVSCNPKSHCFTLILRPVYMTHSLKENKSCGKTGVADLAWKLFCRKLQQVCYHAWLNRLHSLKQYHCNCSILSM